MEDLEQEVKGRHKSDDIRQRVERFADAYEKVGKYLIFTNGGGAVAASAFLGNAARLGFRLHWAVIPLAFFYVGLICSGLMVFGELISRWILIENDPRARDLMVDRNIVLRYMSRMTERPQTIIVISYACLILGGLSAAIVYLYV